MNCYVVPDYFMESEGIIRITLPGRLSFSHNGVYYFYRYLQLFDWTLRNTSVQVDFRQCTNANYQALSLFVLYIWHLQKKGCYVELLYGERQFKSVTTMWYNMGAQGIFHVLRGEDDNFH